METPGLGMSMLTRAWLRRGPEFFIAAPSGDCNVVAVHPFQEVGFSPEAWQVRPL